MTGPAGAVEGPADPLAAVRAFEAERARVLRANRLWTLFWLLAVSALLYVSFQLSGVFEVAFDQRLFDRIATFLDRMTPNLQAEDLWADRRNTGSLAAWYYAWPIWLAALWETVQIAILGTALGAAGAFALAFLAAANVSPLGPARLLIRRFFDLLRTVPDLILAIILSAAFGLGATAGVLTIFISTVGSLGKLFSEAIENADPRLSESITAAGGGWAATMRFGVVPQVLPNHVSYLLLRLEINLAAAAALGIVGAGGIGVELQRAISYTEFDTYLAILLMIVVMIFVIDMISEALRHRLIGLEGKR